MHLITVPNMNKITFFSAISQQTLKVDYKIAIITQILFYMHQWSMVPNMKTIQPVTMEECTRMDGQMDGLTPMLRWSGEILNNNAFGTALPKYIVTYD